MVTLEKIDQLVERTGISYQEAKEVLEKTGGDVIEALIYLENNKESFSKKMSDEINDKKDQIMKTLKEAVRKGNVTKIVVEKDNEVFLNLPLSVAAPAGVVSLALSAPIFLIISGLLGVGAYSNKITIKVVKENGEEININKETQEKFSKMKNKSKKSQEDDIDVTDELINEQKEENDDDSEIIDIPRDEE